ncbi:hypothetical protein D1BOALGB6SA_2027, partial [Olavius sp. associated proteobacterium Delta 1]
QHTNGSDPIIEIDGVAAPFTAAWSLNNKTRTTSDTLQWIGRHYNGSDYHDGYMDELRYSKAARASAWRK